MVMHFALQMHLHEWQLTLPQLLLLSFGQLPNVTTKDDGGKKVPAVIKDKWMRWCLKSHPDHGGDHEVFVERGREYELFKDWFKEHSEEDVREARNRCQSLAAQKDYSAAAKKLAEEALAGLQIRNPKKPAEEALADATKNVGFARDALQAYIEAKKPSGASKAQCEEELRRLDEIEAQTQEHLRRLEREQQQREEHQALADGLKALAHAMLGADSCSALSISDQFGAILARYNDVVHVATQRSTDVENLVEENTANMSSSEQRENEDDDQIESVSSDEASAHDVAEPANRYGDTLEQNQLRMAIMATGGFDGAMDNTGGVDNTNMDTTFAELGQVYYMYTLRRKAFEDTMTTYRSMRKFLAIQKELASNNLTEAEKEVTAKTAAQLEAESLEDDDLPNTVQRADRARAEQRQAKENLKRVVEKVSQIDQDHKRLRSSIQVVHDLLRGFASLENVAEYREYLDDCNDQAVSEPTMRTIFGGRIGT